MSITEKGFVKWWGMGPFSSKDNMWVLSLQTTDSVLQWHLQEWGEATIWFEQIFFFFFFFKLKTEWVMRIFQFCFFVWYINMDVRSWCWLSFMTLFLLFEIGSFTEPTSPAIHSPCFSPVLGLQMLAAFTQVLEILTLTQIFMLPWKALYRLLSPWLKA